MSKITIESYSVKLRDKKTGDYLNFGDVLPAKDFLKFIESFFENLEAKVDGEALTNKLLRVTAGTIKKNNREFTGIVETGEYGYESTFIDADTGKPQYKRKVKDAEMLPFYFLLWLPKDQNIGLILLQRFGLYGISQIFRNSLQSFIKSELPNLSVEFSPIYSDKLLQKVIENGEIKKVTFTKYDIPKNIEDYFEKGAHNEMRGHIEYSLVASRNNKLKLADRLNKLLFGSGKVTRLVELKNFSYDDTKIEFKHGKETRRFVLGDFLKFKAYYDVSEQVKKAKDGHPEFTSINRIATDIRKELEEILYPE
jgi:hypothetical protein